MVFALPAMQQLYSLEISVVSSLVQSGIGTVCIDFFCCCFSLKKYNCFNRYKY